MEFSLKEFTECFRIPPRATNQCLRVNDILIYITGRL